MEPGIHAQIPCQCYAGSLEIRTDYAAPVYPQTLRRELAQDPEPNDCESLAKRRPGASDSLQGDSAEGHRACRLETQSGRDGNGEIPRNAEDFRMVSALGAGAPNAVPWLTIRDAAAYLQDKGGCGGTRGHSRGKLALHRLPCPGDPLFRKHLDNLFDVFRVTGGALPKRLAAGLRGRALLAPLYAR